MRDWRVVSCLDKRRLIQHFSLGAELWPPVWPMQPSSTVPFWARPLAYSTGDCWIRPRDRTPGAWCKCTKERCLNSHVNSLSIKNWCSPQWLFLAPHSKGRNTHFFCKKLIQHLGHCHCDRSKKRSTVPRLSFPGSSIFSAIGGGGTQYLLK